jgi:hypothetical protein
MSDIGSSRPDVDTTRVAYSTAPDPTAWTGWVVFAAFMMLMLGFFQAIEGLVAIFNKGVYHVTPSGLVLNIDYNVWGWVHLLLGVVIFVSGIGILAGNVAARTVAVILAGLSALVNLAFVEAAPVWAIVIITVDVLVIWALTVHGGELRDAS